MGSRVPDEAVKLIESYCEGKVPVDLRDQYRIECSVRGSAVTISERRPPWPADTGEEWTRQPCARLRFDADTRRWSLQWPDRNGRWHGYDDTGPTTDVGALLAVIDVDPTGIFWG